MSMKSPQFCKFASRNGMICQKTRLFGKFYPPCVRGFTSTHGVEKLANNLIIGQILRKNGHKMRFFANFSPPCVLSFKERISGLSNRAMCWVRNKKRKTDIFFAELTNATHPVPAGTGPRCGSTAATALLGWNRQNTGCAIRNEIKQKEQIQLCRQKPALLYVPSKDANKKKSLVKLK